jgi:hypothetical protein
MDNGRCKRVRNRLARFIFFTEKYAIQQQANQLPNDIEKW